MLTNRRFIENGLRAGESKEKEGFGDFPKRSFSDLNKK